MSERCGGHPGRRVEVWTLELLWSLGFGASRRSDSIENSEEPKKPARSFFHVPDSQRETLKFQDDEPMIGGLSFVAGRNPRQECLQNLLPDEPYFASGRR
jgi:hypothetical protein